MPHKCGATLVSLDNKVVIDLNRKNKKKNEPEWPNTVTGEAVPPAFLTHIYGGPLDTELTLNLLEAYGIPHICDYPSNGLFGKLIMGQSAGGIKVFVPETMLEDAQNVLNADTFDEDEEEIDADTLNEDE